MDAAKQYFWQMQRQQWESRITELRLLHQELSAQSRELLGLAAQFRAETRVLCRSLRLPRRRSPPHYRT
jgi:hypothetical protein